MTIAPASILDRCTDDAGCLIWPGACCNGHPSMRIDGKQQLVRRVLWQMMRGPIPAGHILRQTCGIPGCITPGHTQLTSYREIAQQLGALGVMSGLKRSAAIAKTKRKTQAKLTHAAVHDIRSSSKTGVALAREYGVNERTISKVRRHQHWRDFGTNPFQGLLS